MSAKSDLQAEIQAKEAEIAEVEEQIRETEDLIKSKEEEIATLIAATEAAYDLVSQKESQIAFAKAELIALEKRYAVIQRLGQIYNYNATAWCCDLTEGLAIGRTVPTIEVGTEYPELGQIINIFPAYEDGAGLPTYSLNNHGEVLPFVSIPVADALRNFIAMPAIQKWAPTFRYGTLSAVDYESNTCSVNLESFQSAVQSLNINQSNSLTNVPVEYMECDAGAFEVGDDVVVTFTNHDWATPKVIGFKSHPKPCGWEEPWDGPNITWKYPWVYRYGFVSGSGSQATRSITNGIMTMTFPATDSGSGCVEQYHHLQYIPDNLVVTKNITRVKFNASTNISCVAQGGGIYGDFYLVVVGWDEDESHIISNVIRIFYDKYYTGVGCDDYPGYAEYETDWSTTEGTATSVWWLPGGPYPYRVHTRQIFEDKDEYFSFPETLSTVLAVGIETSQQWVGGATYNTPDQIHGGNISCDIIALS